MSSDGLISLALADDQTAMLACKFLIFSVYEGDSPFDLDEAVVAASRSLPTSESLSDDELALRARAFLAHAIEEGDHTISNAASRAIANAQRPLMVADPLIAVSDWIGLIMVVLAFRIKEIDPSGRITAYPTDLPRVMEKAGVHAAFDALAASIKSHFKK